LGVLTFIATDFAQDSCVMVDSRASTVSDAVRFFCEEISHVSFGFPRIDDCRIVGLISMVDALCAQIRSAIETQDCVLMDALRGQFEHYKLETKRLLCILKEERNIG
jgi:hypothetical protein